MAHATRRDGVTRGRGVTPVGRARARGGRRPHAGDAGVFQTVRRRARSDDARRTPRRTTPPRGGAAVLGAAVLDAADDLAAGLFEMDSLVAAAVASARGGFGTTSSGFAFAPTLARASRVASLRWVRFDTFSRSLPSARRARRRGGRFEPHRANHARRFRRDGRRRVPDRVGVGRGGERRARGALARVRRRRRRRRAGRRRDDDGDARRLARRAGSRRRDANRGTRRRHARGAGSNPAERRPGRASRRAGRNLARRVAEPGEIGGGGARGEGVRLRRSGPRRRRGDRRARIRHALRPRR